MGTTIIVALLGPTSVPFDLDTEFSRTESICRDRGL